MPFGAAGMEFPQHNHVREPVLLQGAGASHGSEEGNHQPPLVNGLIETLVKRCPSWETLSDGERRLPASPLSLQ